MTGCEGRQRGPGMSKLWRRVIQTASQLFDDDSRFNFSHMGRLVSVVRAVGQPYGSWGYITIRLYIWELSVLESPRHISATESIVPFIVLLKQQRAQVKPDSLWMSPHKMIPIWQRKAVISSCVRIWAGTFHVFLLNHSGDSTKKTRGPDTADGMSHKLDLCHVHQRKNKQREQFWKAPFPERKKKSLRVTRLPLCGPWLDRIFVCYGKSG